MYEGIKGKWNNKVGKLNKNFWCHSEQNDGQ